MTAADGGAACRATPATLQGARLSAHPLLQRGHHISHRHSDDPPRLHAPCAAGTGALKLRPPAGAAAHPHAQTEGSWRRTGLELPRLAAWDASPGWRQDLGRQQARTTPGFGVVSRAHHGPHHRAARCCFAPTSSMTLESSGRGGCGRARSWAPGSRCAPTSSPPVHAQVTQPCRLSSARMCALGRPTERHR